MLTTTAAPSDFRPDEDPTGEEIQILTLDAGRNAMLGEWSRRMNLTPEEILLRAFDLLNGRLERAAKHGMPLSVSNISLFLP